MVETGEEVRSISQSSNTNTALRTTGSRSNTITPSSNLASLANWNTNCQTPHTSTATSRTAGSGGVLVDINSSNTIVRNDSGGVQKKNNKYNKKAIAQMVTDKKYTEGKVINNQQQWEDVKFGSGISSNMQYSGCEIFAAYNAMVKLGEKITGDQLADMITAFEKNGATLKGDFGTSPVAVYDYLSDKYKKNSNVDVNMYVSKQQRVLNQTVDKIGDQNDIFIATVYNDAENIGAQIHTVCISKEDDESYTVYNAYKQDKDHNYVEKGGYKSLSDAIGDISTNPQLISLIYIDELELGDFPFFDNHIAFV